MLLGDLTRKEQELFLEMCNYCANIDNEQTAEEKEYISQYCHELKLNETEYVRQGMEYEEIINALLSINNRENITKIVMGIIGLVKANGTFNIEEQDFIKKIQKDLNINRYKMLQIYRKSVLKYCG